MGVTSIAELDSRPMRSLAVAVILDAINDAKSFPKDRRGQNALIFLTGETGMLQLWLDCLNDIDADEVMRGIKVLLANNFRRLPPKKQRKIRPKMQIRHGKKRISVQKAADILGYSYSTVYRRHERYPDYTLAQLRRVMPKKDGRSLNGRPGKKQGGCK